ncbi:MAG: prepilin-type N-terminal cleavage/methylation domain-containing protein [Armatimonadota bacterium]
MRALLRYGFTLIELLVVIAIIAVLAAILFPVFAKVREKARQTTCTNNQRQISAAVNMYVQDNNEKFFPDPKSEAWSTYLTGYNEGTIYDCPTHTGKGSNGNPEYGFNQNLFSIPSSQVFNAANVVMSADFTANSTALNYAIFAADSDIDPRHNSGAVMSCADGHLEFIAADKMNVALAATQRYGLSFHRAGGGTSWKMLNALRPLSGTTDLRSLGKYGYYMTSNGAECLVGDIVVRHNTDFSGAAWEFPSYNQIFPPELPNAAEYLFRHIGTGDKMGHARGNSTQPTTDIVITVLIRPTDKQRTYVATVPLPNWGRTGWTQSTAPIKAVVASTDGAHTMEFDPTLVSQQQMVLAQFTFNGDIDLTVTYTQPANYVLFGGVLFD